MANAGADEVFDVEEGPTRPGTPPRTATSRWRAVTSAALERGFGRLSDGDFDQGNVDAVTSVPTMPAVVAVADPPAEIAPDPGPATPPTTGNSRAFGPRGTMRMPSRSDRGPTGTVRMPRRAAPAAPAAPTPRRPHKWRALILFALVGCVQVVFLAENVPAPPVETSPPAAPAVIPTVVQVSQPPAEPLTEANPPAAVETSPAPAPTHARPQPRSRARKAHETANVF